MRWFILCLLFVLFLTTMANADYLNTKTSNHCIIDLTPKQNSNGWCYHDQNTGDDVCDRRLTMDDLIDGYYLDDGGNCVLKHDLAVTGLTQSEWNYSMTLLAHALGFTMFFLVNFLAVLISRK